MVRLLQVKPITERKKMLLIQSELHRHTLRLQVDTFAHSCNAIKDRFKMLSLSSLAFSAVASIAGIWVSKMRGPSKKGIISRIISGFSFFNQAKGIFNRFKDHALHREQR